MPPPPGSPEVVAHRGASHDVAEHTLGAYMRAIEVGADALECDVRLTADGHLVCVHDRRVDRTSNGRGPVSALELAHLEELDWASWRSGPGAGPLVGEVPDRDAGRLLTLNRLLAAVADSGSGVRLAIETKHPTRWGGEVERRLLESLGRFGWAAPRSPAASRVRVMSFSSTALARVRRASPALPLVQLVDRVPTALVDGRMPKGVATCGVSVRTLRREDRWVRRVQRRGTPVHVYTVDTRVDLDLALASGVEAVITNRPAEVLQWLGRGAGDAHADPSKSTVCDPAAGGSRAAVRSQGAPSRGRGAR